MTRSDHRRLDRLATAIDAAGRAESPLEAVLAGTATIDHIRGLAGTRIDQFRTNLLAQAPPIAALLHSRRQPWCWPTEALGVPPDRPLADYGADWLQLIAEVARGPLEEAHHTSLLFHGADKPWQWHMLAQTALVAFGDEQATLMRELAWELDDEGFWRLSERAWAAAETKFTSLHNNEYGLIPQCTYDEADRHVSSCQITLAEAARRIGEPRVPAL